MHSISSGPGGPSITLGGQTKYTTFINVILRSLWLSPVSSHFRINLFLHNSMSEPTAQPDYAPGSWPFIPEIIGPVNILGDVDWLCLTLWPDLYQISSTAHIMRLTHNDEFRMFSMWFPDFPGCFVCLHVFITLQWDLHVLRGSNDKPGLQWVKPINVAG